MAQDESEEPGEAEEQPSSATDTDAADEPDPPSSALDELRAQASSAETQAMETQIDMQRVSDAGLAYGRPYEELEERHEREAQKARRLIALRDSAERGDVGPIDDEIRAAEERHDPFQRDYVDFLRRVRSEVAPPQGVAPKADDTASAVHPPTVDTLPVTPPVSETSGETSDPNPDTGHYDDGHGWGWRQPAETSRDDWVNLKVPLGTGSDADDLAPPSLDPPSSSTTSRQRGALIVAGVAIVMAAAVAVFALRGGGKTEAAAPGVSVVQPVTATSEAASTVTAPVKFPPSTSATEQLVAHTGNCQSNWIAHATVSGDGYAGDQAVLRIDMPDGPHRFPFTVTAGQSFDVPFTETACNFNYTAWVETVDGIPNPHPPTGLTPGN